MKICVESVFSYEKSFMIPIMLEVTFSDDIRMVGTYSVVWSKFNVGKVYITYRFYHISRSDICFQFAYISVSIPH